MALLFLGKTSGRQEPPGPSAADGAGGAVQGWEEPRGTAWAPGAGGFRGQGRTGPVGTAECEGAAEPCLSEHEERIRTLRWLGTLPSSSSYPSGPGLRWRSCGGWVPAPLPLRVLLGCRHYPCPAPGLFAGCIYPEVPREPGDGLPAALGGWQPCGILHQPSAPTPAQETPAPWCWIRALWGGMRLSSSLCVTARLHPASPV